MELNSIKHSFVLVVATLIMSMLFNCGTNYFYNKEGGIRPRENNFNVSKLGQINYKVIDTNAIYINSRNWFYKFYSKNKVGYGFLDTNLTSKQVYNPKRLKMGYFEMKEKQIITYVFINKGIKLFSRELISFNNDSIVSGNDIYRYKPILNNLSIPPDW